MDMYRPEEYPINELRAIIARGWIVSAFSDDDNSVSNNLLKLIGAFPSNSPRPNAGNWQVKTQRKHTKSLLSLFSFEPFPQENSIVSKILIPQFGWSHERAGEKYPVNERSFCQTLSTQQFSNRGFIITVNDDAERIFLSFDYSKIADEHQVWRDSLNSGIGSVQLSPEPYWEFAKLFRRFQHKAKNYIFVLADEKHEDGKYYVKFDHIWLMRNISQCDFIQMFREGKIKVDVNAHTRHNHGCHFRISREHVTELYQDIIPLS